MLAVIQRYDMWILDYTYIHFHNLVLDKMMPLVTSLGNGAIIWIIISAILMLNKKYRNIGFMVLGSLLLSSLIADCLLKNIIQRVRVIADIPTVNLLIPMPLSYSFPSGHTATSFAAAGVLAKEFKRYRIYFLALASVIAFSRIYLYVHYPTDIISGIVIGLICAYIVLILSKSKTAQGLFVRIIKVKSKSEE